MKNVAAKPSKKVIHDGLAPTKGRVKRTLEAAASTPVARPSSLRTDTATPVRELRDCVNDLVAMVVNLSDVEDTKGYGTEAMTIGGYATWQLAELQLLDGSESVDLETTRSLLMDAVARADRLLGRAILAATDEDREASDREVLCQLGASLRTSLLGALAELGHPTTAEAAE